MPRKPLDKMSPEELDAYHEKERERQARRRQNGRTTEKARKVVQRIQNPTGDKTAAPKAPTKDVRPEGVRTDEPTAPTPTPAPAFSAPPVSPRLYIRAAHLAGYLEAMFGSGGAVALAKEDEARDWLHGSPLAQSVVGELLATAGFLEEYQAWASLD